MGQNTLHPMQHGITPIIPTLQKYQNVNTARQNTGPHFGKAQDQLNLSTSDKDIERFFLDMVAIASPMLKEQKIRDYYIGQLKTMGVQYHPHLTPAEMKRFKDGAHCTVDAKGNLLVYIPSNMNRLLASPPAYIPNLVVSAHLDTVEPTSDGIKPIIQDKDGDRIYHAPPGSVLGADDKAPLAAFLKDIELTLKTSSPQPTKTYALTVDEEGDITGSRDMDPDWYNDAHLMLSFDNIGAPGQILHNQAPACVALELTVMPADSPSSKQKRSFKEMLNNLFTQKKTLQISSQGKSAHLSEYAKGESAVLALIHSVQDFVGQLDGRITTSVKQFQGGQARNAVPQNADATIQLTGNRKQIKQAEQLLETAISKTIERFPQAQKETHPIRKNKGTVPPSHANLPNAALMETLQNIPNGIQSNNAIVNVGLVRPTPDGGIVATMEIRAKEIETANALKDEIKRQLETVAKKTPQIKAEMHSPCEFSNYLTPPDHPAVVQMVSVYRDTFGKEPIVQSAAGLGDSHNFARANSSIYPGKVPTLETGASWHNAHTPGDERGIGQGEWASLREMTDITKLLQALSTSIAEQTVQKEKA